MPCAIVRVRIYKAAGINYSREQGRPAAMISWKHMPARSSASRRVILNQA